MPPCALREHLHPSRQLTWRDLQRVAGKEQALIGRVGLPKHDRADPPDVYVGLPRERGSALSDHLLCWLAKRGVHRAMRLALPPWRQQLRRPGSRSTGCGLLPLVARRVVGFGPLLLSCY